MIRVEDVGKVFVKEDVVRARVARGMAFADAVTAEEIVPALSGVSLSVAEGEIYAIMGLSGSGKSTLVRCINGLVRPTEGSITVAGTSVSTASPGALRKLRQQRMSMVFQSFALLPHLSVAKNVEFGLMLRSDDAAARRARAAEMLERVGLSAWRDRRVHELSGGMRQRVGLARALATDPDILIMDEPFSALDPLIRRSLQDELLKLQRELRKTIVFVTHDFDEATRLGNRVMIMKAGCVVQVGAAAELFTHPADDYVREFTSHVDCMQLLTAGDLARAMPVSEEEHLPLDATGAIVFDSGAPLARVLSELRLGAVISLEGAAGGERRFLTAGRVLEYVSRLYSSRRESAA